MGTITSLRKREPLPELLLPAEAAAILRIDPKTLVRWANKGKLRTVRTLGSAGRPGDRRYFADEVRALRRQS
jgi:predicted site-specific integrase-resolvase